MARVNLSIAEKEKLQKEFEAILGYISILKEVDSENEENNFSKNKPINEMRLDEDAHEAGKFTKDLLRSVPFAEGGHVKVKYIFE